MYVTMPNSGAVTSSHPISPCTIHYFLFRNTFISKCYLYYMTFCVIFNESTIVLARSHINIQYHYVYFTKINSMQYLVFFNFQGFVDSAHH